MTITDILKEDKVFQSLHPHLSKTDFHHFALVNKTWKSAFQPLVWRHLSFSGARFSTLFDNSDDFTKVILKNAAHIEYLQFRGCSNPATFLLFFSPCRNIRSLSCHLKFELPQDVFACLAIVEQNQGLDSFYLSGIPIKRLGVAQKFLQVLSQHTSLRSVEFESADSKISEHLLTAILQSIPPTLEFLDLKWSIEIQDDNDFEYRDHHVTLPGWSDNGIKTIELNRVLTGYEDSVVIPFLRHCVHLKSFRPPPNLTIESGPHLTQILREHCPSLKSVLISNQDHDSVIAAVVNGSRALEEFRIRYYGSVGSDLVSSLVVQATHLHTIEFENGIFVRSADIQTILSTCPGLRTFTVEDWQEDGHESFLEIKDMVSSPWVCLGLRNLMLPMGSNYGVSVEQGAENIRQQRQGVITKAYKQLGALKELRTLSFGVRVPQENSNQFLLDLEGHQDFDMTLATGLDEMKDLKRLWRLEVSGLRHRMREKELEWIDANWPSFEFLGGIYMYEGEELSEDEEMYENDEEEEEDEEEGEDEEEEEDIDSGSVAGDEADEEGVEQEMGPDGPDGPDEPEPEGKLTRRHVAWFLERRPYAKLY
ncbi:hypothetical protein BGZ95_011572 [Linnemannia exigua]|uniref:F-box domain-containing protein n=1 Tax=Linnemannia exigua TaxID=604196 RepID=A0AAD4DBQ9_9FUNG|nr:hypothetical protein BGZ95_011572 [Linnemannia exigua]